MSRARPAGRRRALGALVVLSAGGMVPTLPWTRHAGASEPAALARLPAPVIASAGELRRLGVGTMRWFGLHVYDAALWVRGAQWDANDVYALDILYGRDLTGKALAESSISEMKRVGFTDEAQHARWLPAMTRVFPNVTRGDRLVGVHRAGVASFYSQDRALGVIDDPMFASAFFSIWLDPKTREPQLRARLLGKS